MQKLRYLSRCLLKRILRQPALCPSCGAPDGEVVQTKYAVTQLRRCGRCRLLYRYPQDDREEAGRFYQRAYSQGITTDCPDDAALQALLAGGFRGHEKDFAPYLEALRALGVAAGAAVVDFGCSWGYGTWQLQRAGYNVQGCEISRARAAFGREKLSVPIVTEAVELRPGADVFFSAHVLEHVPSIHEAAALARRVLKPGGLFLAFTPNGSSGLRQKDPAAHRRLWGQVHPNLLSDEFYQKLFEGQPLLLASSPYDLPAVQSWDQRGTALLDCSGPELMAAAVIGTQP